MRNTLKLANRDHGKAWCCWITGVIDMFVRDVQGDESSKLLPPCQTESFSILLKIPWHLKGFISAEYSRFVSVPTDIINVLGRLFYDGDLVFLGFEFIGTSLPDE